MPDSAVSVPDLRPQDPRIRRLRVLVHVCFWLGYLLLVSLALSNVLPIERALLRTCIMAAFLAPMVYLNLGCLMPRFLERGQYTAYFAWLSLLVAADTGLRMLADYGLSLHFSAFAERIWTLKHLAGTLLSGCLMLLITTPVKLVDDLRRRQQQEQALRGQRLEAELKFLKAQVNPHFLFNALNNLYALAFTGSPQTAPMILKLSELMRYLLYDARAEVAPLADELAYVRNYIEFQQLKTPDPQDITFETAGDLQQLRIPPMLLGPLVENAFKHGNPDQRGGWLRIRAAAEGQQLRFTVENSISPGARKDGTGGIGLENIRQRLQLLYPGRHRLEIEASEDRFRVTLDLAGPGTP
ncbi:MAG: histidine kinase [Bacteroidia bacterium]|nr:histidine kinase [Bacteroidia bacterium]